MRTRVKLLIAVLFNIMLLSVAAQAQAGMKPVADTGMLTPGPGQVLRITVATVGAKGDENIRVRLRQMEYMEQGNIYRVVSSSTSPPIALTSDEAVSIDVPNTGSPVRAVVVSNSPNVKVVGIVFDTSTQRVVAICTFIPD